MSVAVVAWRCMCAMALPGGPNALLAKALKVQHLSSRFCPKLCALQGPRSSANIAFAPWYFTIGRTAALGDVLHALPGPILYCAVRRHTPVITTEQTYDRPIVAFDSLGPRSSGSRPKAPTTANNGYKVDGRQIKARPKSSERMKIAAPGSTCRHPFGG